MAILQQPKRGKGFYTYYQIDQDSQQSEPDESEESKPTNEVVGGNSLWGIIDMIAQRYGWTFHYIINDIAWINIRMMLGDSIRTKSIKKDDTVEEMTDDEMFQLNEE